MTGQTHTGRCLCGTVQFSATVPNDTFSVCHCGMCRRWSAGPYMSVRSDGPVTITQGAETLVWYRGSEWAERGFCKQCGTSLFYRLANQPDLFTAIAVDALDDADAFSLQRHIYTDAQPNRYSFADSQPRVTEAELMKELGVEKPDE
jgi:hypothetical protein